MRETNQRPALQLPDEAAGVRRGRSEGQHERVEIGALLNARPGPPGAMEALPLTTDVLVQLTGRERRKMELLAYGLQ